MFRWASDPDIRRDVGLRQAPSREHTEAWVRHAEQDPAILPLAIYRDSEHVGNIVLDRIDTFIQSGRLSIYLGPPEARGAGAGRTAVYLACREGFEKLELHKIWLTVHTRNVAAINAYTRLGFRLEGILRDEFWLDGRRADLLYMGLIRDEYRALTVQWRPAKVAGAAP
jgi:RimJ/RimL family protein N-acetyltransferase